MPEALMVELIQWVVRGVDKDLARQFVDRAASQRRATGAVLNELLRAYLERSEDPIAPEASPGIEEAGDLRALVLALQEHLMRQEQTTLKYVAMTESLSEKVKALEQQIATRPARDTPDKRRSPTVITDDLHRQILDLRAQGLKRHEICEQLGLSDGTVSKYMKLPRPADRPADEDRSLAQ
jgi:DNA-binding NarL/FixJ family response regulator